MKPNLSILKINKKTRRYFRQAILLLVGLTCLAIMLSLFLTWRENQNLAHQLANLGQEKLNLQGRLAAIGTELEEFKAVDQYQRNETLQAEIKAIEETYTQAVAAYEDLLLLKEEAKKTNDEDEAFAESLSLLAERNYASASATLKTLTQAISQRRAAIAAAFVIPESVPVESAPPGSGYRRQQVKTDVGTFMVSLVAADLNSTRVIADTASDGDCHDNCPALPLATFISRSGAYAGINGPYFCPATYPSCANKKNSFDTLLMNKNKTYFNSDNNLYSTVPAVVFSGNNARFINQSLEWGRDTGVDAVIANYPLLTLNNELRFTGSTDSKLNSKGSRSFIGATGNTVYIGVVHSANVAEAARVVNALGIHSALNLDSGGSTALWSGGYKVGPGRNLAVGILLVRK